MPDNAANIVGLIVALLGAGGIGGILTVAIQSRKIKHEIEQIDATAEKTRAETMETQAGAWAKLVDSLQWRITDLTTSVALVEAEMAKKDKRIQELECEVIALRQELAEYQTGRKRKTGPLGQA